MASIRCNWCRRSPAGRQTATAMVSISAKPQVSRCLSGRSRTTTSACWDTEKRATLGTCRRRDRTAAGAAQAMRAALTAAGLAPSQIDYINLHGTATPANDIAEDSALLDVFDGRVVMLLDKGLHGAYAGRGRYRRGAVRMHRDRERCRLPEPEHDTRSTTEFVHRFCLRPNACLVTRAMTNSFGFGGTNASLILGRAA